MFAALTKFVARLLRYGGGSDSDLGLKMVLAFDNFSRDLLGSQIELIENCMEKYINAWAAKCAGCKVRDPTQSERPTQSARAHAKCAGCIMSARDAKCADASKMCGQRFNCAGRTECPGRNCMGRWVGRTAHVPSPHLPCNANAMQPQFHSRGPWWAAIARHVKS